MEPLLPLLVLLAAAANSTSILPTPILPLFPKKTFTTSPTPPKKKEDRW